MRRRSHNKWRIQRWRGTEKCSPKRIAILLLLAPLCVILASNNPPSVLDEIMERGQLHVVSRNGPTTFYEGAHGLTGFEYTLTRSFADYLGVELVIHNENNLGLLLDTLGTDEGANLGAAGLTVTEKRQRQVTFGEPYLDITQQLLYRKGESRPEGVEDLIGSDILVIANSSHVERLRALQKQHPALRWREDSHLEMIDLVEMVHSGAVQYAIVDSNAFQINRSVFPKAQVAFDISEPQQLAWAFPKQGDPSLYRAATAFFKSIREDGRLTAIQDYYYNHEDQVEQGGALVFSRRIESRLPQWEPHLREAGEEESIDWRLLAAISYQESHWDSKARSHTGVRGLMMLTQATARDMGIANRIDPQQSIAGGARYYKNIFERIPQRIQGPDRTWLALAAYNVGFGHLEDARILTEQHGDNPDKWADVEKYLPLLAKRKYYENTKNGYARGWEPVEYVQNIRNYYNILSWHGHQENRRLAATEQTATEDKFQSVNSEQDDRSSLSL